MSTQRSNAVLVFAAVLVAAIVIIYAVVGRGSSTSPGQSPEQPTATLPDDPLPLASTDAGPAGDGVTHIDQTTDTTHAPAPERAGDAAPGQGAPAAGQDDAASAWEGLHPLHAAATRGDAEAIQALVAGGADPDGRLTGSVAGGVTPLMLAVQTGHVGAVFALLNAGADLTLRDDARRAARDYALARFDRAGQTIARVLGEAAGPPVVQDPGEK